MDTHCSAGLGTSFVAEMFATLPGKRQHSEGEVAEFAVSTSDMNRLPTCVIVALLECEELLSVIQAHAMQTYGFRNQHQLDWARAQLAQVSKEHGTCHAPTQQRLIAYVQPFCTATC